MIDHCWVDILLESDDQDQDIHWLLIEGIEDGFLILPAITEVYTEAFPEVISETERSDQVLARLRKKGWSTAGRSLATLLKHVDPRFINHADHYDRLIHGGNRPDGTPFPGGGGLRWGGLVITNKEALLRVMGSFEWKDKQDEYQQTLCFANFHKIARAAGVNWMEKARMLMRDRIKIHCDCPAYRYYHAYAASQKKFALYPELRPANKTNPENRGGVCKHLHLVLKNLEAQAAKIAGEMKAYYGGRKKKPSLTAI